MNKTIVNSRHWCQEDKVTYKVSVMEMSHLMLLCMVLLLLCFYMVYGLLPDAYSKEDFPDPRKNFTKCSQEKPSNICDPSQSLTKLEVQTLDSLIKRLQGSCLCHGHDFICKPFITQDQILVAIVPRIKDSRGRYPQTVNKNEQLTRQFAEYLRDEGWIRSKYKRCALHVIIVVDLNTTTIWTATNLFASKIITDYGANETALDAKAKYLRTKNVFVGLNEMLTKYKTLLHQGLPLLDGYIDWLFTGITILILLVLLGISHCYSQQYFRRDGAGSEDRSDGVWRVSGLEVVIVVVGIAVVEVFGTMVGTAAVGAVLGAAVANKFNVVVRTTWKLVLQMAIVMLVASAVGIMVAVPFKMTGTVGWTEVFGAALVIMVGKVIVIGVSAGVGVFGAAVLEVFKAVGAAAMVFGCGTAGVVAGWGAAKMMEVVVHAAEWKLPGVIVGQIVLRTVWNNQNINIIALMVLVMAMSVLLIIVAVMVSSVEMRVNEGLLRMWVFIYMLYIEVFIVVMALMLGVVVASVMLAVLVVLVFGVVAGIVLVMVLGTVVAATIVAPMKLSNVEIVEKVVPIVVVSPIEVVKAPEVGAVKAVVTGVVTVALVTMLVAWVVAVFKVY